MPKNAQTTTQLHSSHTLVKLTLKILQAKLQQYVNNELPDVQAGFREDRGTRDQIATICWVIKKAKEFQKNVYFCFTDYAKAFDCVDNNKLWKILKEMGISDHLTCLMRNLYAGQEATVRTGHVKTDWFQIGKGVHQGCILSPCLFKLHAEFSSVAQSCLTLCNPMDSNMPGLPVLHQLPEFTQTHVHWVGDAIRSSHPLLSPFPPAFNLSQHQDLFQRVSSSHQVAKYWSFSFSISPSNEYSRLIFFRMDWYIIWNAGLDEAQAGIKIARRNINNLKYGDDTTFTQKAKN